MVDNFLAAIFFISIGVTIIVYTKIKYTRENHEKEADKYKWTNKDWFAFSWLFFFMSKSYIVAKLIIYFTGLVCIAIGLLALFSI